jgi:hypothetical protein
MQQRLAGRLSRHVLHDKDRRRETGRQLAPHLIKRFQASRRNPDNDRMASVA